MKNTLSADRKDAREIIEMLKVIPEIKKREVLGIIRGYALYAESEKTKQKEGVL